METEMTLPFYLWEQLIRQSERLAVLSDLAAYDQEANANREGYCGSIANETILRIAGR